MNETDFVIETSMHNGCDRFSCIFCHKDKWYYADLCCVKCVGNECMIFPYNKRKKDISSWVEVYCNRHVSLTEECLIDCINEFCSEEDKR